MKKRILFCGDKTTSRTGFSFYMREMLKDLHVDDRFEVAELGYASQLNEKKNVAWKLYTTVVDNKHPQYKNFVRNAEVNKNGLWRFNAALIHFKPHIVFTPQDAFLCAYQGFSPLKDYFNWIMAPPIDSHPQKTDFLMAYNQADYLYPYTTYGEEVLKYYGFKPQEVVPMSVDLSLFNPKDKKECKRKLKFPEDSTIFGFVARNQPRKRIPELMQAFKNFRNSLPEDEQSKVILHIHTSFPEPGPRWWDISKIVVDLGLHNNLYFSYVCDKTNRTFCSLFRDVAQLSPFYEGSIARTINLSGKSSTDEDLALIYNATDLYIQCADCEGFGHPVIQAAACETPVLSMNHSAMAPVAKMCNSDLLDPINVHEDIGSQARRGNIDIEGLTSYMMKFYKGKREKQTNHENIKNLFDYKLVNKKWKEIFLSIPNKKSWDSSPVQYSLTQPKQQIMGALTPVVANNIPNQWNLSELEQDKRIMRGMANGQMAANYFNQVVQESNILEAQRIGHAPFEEEDWMK